MSRDWGRWKRPPELGLLRLGSVGWGYSRLVSRWDNQTAILGLQISVFNSIFPRVQWKMSTYSLLISVLTWAAQHWLSCMGAPHLSGMATMVVYSGWSHGWILLITWTKRPRRPVVLPEPLFRGQAVPATSLKSQLGSSRSAGEGHLRILVTVMSHNLCPSQSYSWTLLLVRRCGRAMNRRE